MQLLGPVRAWRSGRELDLGSPRQRSLFALLALRAGHPVPRQDIVAALWEENPPAKVAGSVHTYVSGLRRALTGRQLPAATDGGYRLPGNDMVVDATVFGDHCATAKIHLGHGRPVAAVRCWDEALALWSGAPLAGLPGPFAQHQRVRLTEARLTAVCDRAAVLVTLPGRAASAGGLAAELLGWVQEHPLREELREALMLALCRAGRSAEALRQFHELSRALDAELGVRPGPRLRALHERILREDPGLSDHAPAVRGRGTPDHEPLPPAKPAQLPHDLSEFIGRTTELATLTGLFTAAPARGHLPLALITGVAGVGKTSLAVHAAHLVALSFPDGQLHLDLRGHDPVNAPTDPATALIHLLRALGVDPRRVPDDLDGRAALFRSVLDGRRMLLLLDNAHSADQIGPLLPGGTGSGVLVTSRNRLPGLLARHGAAEVELAPLAATESRSLLAALLGMDRVTAEPTPATRLTVLCGHLPLAVRVAAERVLTHPHRTLADLVAELDAETDRLDLLDGQDHTGVRAVFSWSYRTLPPAAARLFRLLGLHPGPEFAAAAATALNGSDAGAGLDLLTAAHLLEPLGQGRYRLHDLVRLYAAELAQRVPAGKPVRRLLDWYMHTAAAAARHLGVRHAELMLPPPEPGCLPRSFADRVDSAAWFAAEHENLLAATRLAAESGLHRHAWLLPAVLIDHLVDRKPWATWFHANEIALAAAQRSGDQDGQRWTRLNLAIAHVHRAEYDQAAELLITALDTVDSPDEVWSTIQHTLGEAYFGLGQPERALGYYLRAGAAYRELGLSGEWLMATNNSAKALTRLGEYEEALAHLGTALTAVARIGDHHALGHTHFHLAEVYELTGELSLAEAHYRQALTVRAEAGDRVGEAESLHRLGGLLLTMGEPDRARTAWQRALSLVDRFELPHVQLLRQDLAALEGR
ncbi:BTAD domain-containing putative transcriptional regulator [Crossiella cryophila]